MGYLYTFQLFLRIKKILREHKYGGKYSEFWSWCQLSNRILHGFRFALGTLLFSSWVRSIIKIFTFQPKFISKFLLSSMESSWDAESLNSENSFAASKEIVNFLIIIYIFISAVYFVITLNYHFYNLMELFWLK